MKREYAIYPNFADDDNIEYMFLEGVYLVNPNYLESFLNTMDKYGYEMIELKE